MTAMPQPEPDLKSLLEALDTGYWEYDHRLDRMTYSPRLRAWLGNDFPAGEFATLAEWIARIHADDRPVAEAAIQAYYASNAPYRLEYRFIRSDGNSIWLDVRGVAVERDADGKPLRTLGTKVDTTQRRQQEELLRLQQRFNQILLDNPDHARLVEAMLDTVLALSELDGGGLYELCPDGSYSLVASRGISTEFLAHASEIEPGSPRALLLQAGRAACSCIQPTVACTDPDLVRQPQLQAEGITALLVYPIAVSGRIYASLNLASKHVLSMPVQIVAFLESIALQFGQALERLQARQDALQQRQNLDGFFQAMTDFVFVLDHEGRILHFNPAVNAHLGYDNSLLGQSVLSVHPARVHEEAMQVVGDMLAGRRESCPLPLLCADGREIQVDTRIVQGSWNGMPALLGISRDISQLQAVQDELQRRDRYQRALLDNFPFMVWLKDRNSQLLAVNQAYAKVAGQSDPEGMVGKSDGDFWAPELARHYQADDRAVLDSGQARTVEEEIEENGRRFWLETYKSPVTLDGEVIGTVGFAREITDRIEAHKRLLEQEANLRTALNELEAERDLFVGGPVVVLIWRTTDNWPLEYASPNIASVFGYSPQVMLSPDFHYADCIHPDDVAHVGNEVAGYLADRQRASWEQRYRIVLPDGSVRWIYDFTRAERDADGHALRLRGYVMDETAQHESALALSLAKEQLQFAIEGSGVGLWDWEVQTGRVRFNERWAEIIGYQLAELEPVSIETWTRLAHPDDLSKSAANLEAYFKGAVSRYVCEARIRHKDGHWVWVLDQGQVVEWSGDDPASRIPLRMVGTHLDISERKRMQEALEHERGFLKTLVQTIPDLVWLKDPKGVYLACNPRFEQLYAAREADIVGKTDYDFVSEELADFFRANDLAAIAAGRSRINEEWLDFADGSPGGLFETSKTPMLAADGSVIGVLGIAHDITAARNAENALRESGERRRQLMEVSRDGIAIINQQHRLIEANRRFAEMLGYGPEDVLKLHTWDWEANLSEDDVRSQFADLSQISATFETVHRRRDGSCFEVEVSATGAIVDGVAVVITVSRDISQRKAVERALRESEAALNLAQQVANIGSWQLDIAENRLHWSDQIYRIFGISPGMPVSLDIFIGCIHPDDRNMVMQAWQAALQGAPYDIEHRIVSGERERWVREQAQISFVDGKPVIGIGTVQDITERRQARNLLQQSEERYRILADYSTDWQYWLGPDGNYLYVSPGCESITGYPPQAFLQDADLMRSIMHLDDWNMWDAHLKAIATESEQTSHVHAQMEFRIISRDGSVHWIEHQCQPVSTNTAEYKGRRGVNRDITQRKLAELSLRAERDRSQRYLDTIEAVIVALDRDGNITLINRKGCELLGYHVRELLGKNRFERCLPQPHGMNVVFPAFRQIIAGNIEQAEYFENSVLTRSGTQRLIAWHNSVIRDVDGRISGALSAGEDVTEQRAAERALAESSLFLRESQQIARVGGWKSNLDDESMVWTDEIYRLMELPPGSQPSLEQRLSLYAPEYRLHVAQALQEAWKTGHPFTLEAEMALPSGHRFWAELRCIGRVEDVDGAYLAGTFQDISERKAIQSELEQHRVHLEGLVVQRTRELVAERERAEAASRTKSTFLANMSHEIRTPMNAILGLTHLMQNAATDAKQQDQLAKVSAAAQHLLSIINDILDISKIEAGKMRMEVTDFQLDRVIDKVLDLIRDDAQAKGIRLSREIDPTLPPVLRGDALRLGQVLLNFAGNALKFTAQGAISVEARCVSSAPEAKGLRVRFEVSDTGIGMSEDQVARLFQAFEQADASTSRKYGGTGLGLAISKRLVGLMGGDEVHDIGVVSQPGGGSRFWCEIPFEQGSVSPEPTAPRGDELRLALAGCVGARILLAEDNPINQEVALQLLAEAGLGADVANNGSEALALLQRNEYDLVLMDVQMPVLDGLAATREIRAMPQHADLPILAMTANAYDEDRERCLLAGMNDHIAKPVDPKMLYAALLKWLPAKAPPVVAPAETETTRTKNVPEATAVLDPAGFLVDGLDVAAGLKRVGGKTASYLRLLGMYCDMHLGDMALLRDKLAVGDWSEAQRIAHSLKGASGTLGVVAVQVLAASLESLIRNQADRVAIEAAVVQLETVQARLVGELRVYLTGPTTNPAATRVDAAGLKAILAELESLLRADDLSAAALLRAQQPMLATALSASVLALLRRQVDSYDFAGALETLAAAEASGHEPAGQ